jgi:hypothetical protein
MVRRVVGPETLPHLAFHNLDDARAKPRSAPLAQSAASLKITEVPIYGLDEL